MTAILIPTGKAVRVAFNRDESLNRPPARPLQIRRLGERNAILPLDPQSRGSWIGVNDVGILAAVLNVNPPHRYINHRPTSRGALVPAALEHSTLEGAIVTIVRLPLTQYQPFRLMLVQRAHAAEVVWDDQTLQITPPRALCGPLFATSSGLGDHAAVAPRRELFEATVLRRPHDADAQTSFHHHRWPHRSEISVCMQREGAATVSVTVVTLCESSAQVAYRAGRLGEGGSEQVLTLPLVER